MELSDIKNVLILGSGTLGLRVGLACALNGYKVTIYDISEKAFENAKKIQQDLLKSLIKLKTITEDSIEPAVANITWTTDAQLAGAHADLVSESVTEDVAIKKVVWEQFGKICPEHTIFTTNTSYLVPSTFSESTGRPERFCALHFHDVFFSNVVDVMPNPKTEDWLIPLLTDFGKSIGQIPVFIKRESPGYIFNAMLGAVLKAAGKLVTYDVADIEDVDRSWMGNFKAHVGPFGMMDEIGLETVWHITKNNNDPKSIKFAELLKSYIDQGKLGKKTGEGFYSYPRPRFRDKDFLVG